MTTSDGGGATVRVVGAVVSGAAEAVCSVVVVDVLGVVDVEAVLVALLVPHDSTAAANTVNRKARQWKLVVHRLLRVAMKLSRQ
ncbi:MAG: hypothetical protein R8J94_15470 [Acidimicrobiia bacterium]|nr:hypothetical protein [Acidimicrobiia bacterium]